MFNLSTQPRPFWLGAINWLTIINFRVNQKNIVTSHIGDHRIRFLKNSITLPWMNG